MNYNNNRQYNKVKYNIPSPLFGARGRVRGANWNIPCWTESPTYMLPYSLALRERVGVRGANWNIPCWTESPTYMLPYSLASFWGEGWGEGADRMIKVS